MTMLLTCLGENNKEERKDTTSQKRERRVRTAKSDSYENGTTMVFGKGGGAVNLRRNRSMEEVYSPPKGENAKR